MTETTGADLLREAARLIDRAVLKLDTSSEHCPTCQRREFLNFPHAKLYEKLTDWPEKLRARADEWEEADAPVAEDRPAHRSGNRI